MPFGDLREQLVDVVIHGDDDAPAGDRPPSRVHPPGPHSGDRGAEAEFDAEGDQVAHDRVRRGARIRLQVGLDVRAADESLGAERGRPQEFRGFEHADASLTGCRLQHGELVVVSGGDQRARLSQPESRIPREAQPQVAREIGVAPRLATLRADAEVSEVADRRTDRPIRAVDDDRPQPTPDRRVRRTEADDAGADDDHIRRVESAIHRNTFRIHMARPSTTSTVARIISTMAVTVS